jgi:quinol monooxygenase YgiN
VTSPRLYIYFRVKRESEAAAVQALRELHAAWQVPMPGLRCELMRRADQSAEVTLMEAYRCNDGVSAEWQQRIEREATACLEAWLIGQRHVEVFEPCA